jgi:PKD repeat protein
MMKIGAWLVSPLICRPTHLDFREELQLHISRLVQTVMVTVLAASPLLADSSADCRTWRVVNPRPAGQVLNSVAAGPERLVAVGDMGAIQVSPAGVSWTTVESGIDIDLKDVIWAGDAFLAVGDAGTILRSEDGLAWSILPADLTDDLTTAVFGNGVTVVMGSGSMIYSSSDLEGWSVHNRYDSPATELIWAGTRFVAVGSGWASVSPDGFSWTVSQASAFSGDDDVVLTWNGSVIHGFRRGLVFFSFDGVDWVFSGVLANRLSFAVDTVWTGSGYITAGRTWYFAVSPDGIEWASVEELNRHNYFRVANGLTWSGEQAVAVGTASTVAISPTGFEWQQAQSADNADADFVAVAASDDSLVAVSYYDGKVGISADGFSWDIYPGLQTRTWDVTYGNGRFVTAGGNRGWVATSSDGISWTTNQVGEADVTAVVWSGDRFYALMDHYSKNEKYIYSSPDGESWTVEVERGNRGQFLDITSGNGVTVVVGTERNQEAGCYSDCPLIGVTTSGGEWQWQLLSTTPLTYARELSQIVWGPDRWLAVGRYGYVLTSTDLEEWEIVETGSGVYLSSIIWNGAELLGTSSAGVLSSLDGLSWQLEPTPTSNRVYELAWFNDAWFGVGGNGTVLLGACNVALDPPQAGFTVETTTLLADSPIRFSDASRGDMLTWQWSFGDGGTSSAASPLHIFSEPGSYEITQTVCNDTGCDTATDQLVIVAAAPIADLVSEQFLLYADEPVQWRDLSIGQPTEWQWHLGDGSSSSDQHPTHTYAVPGFYHISLQAGNAYGSDQKSRVIMVGRPQPVPDDLPDSAALHDLKWGANRWVVVGDNGLAASSWDATSWTVHDTGTETSLRSLSWTGEAFVAVGDGAIVVSSDGRSWQTVLEGASAELLKAVAGNREVVVAVGSNGLILRSEDLESWLQIDSGTTDHLIGIAAGQDLFVAITKSLDTPPLESTTGLEWTAAEGEFGRQQSVVAATSQGFVVSNDSRLYWRQDSGLWVADEHIDHLCINVADIAIAADRGIVVASQSGSYWYNPEGVWLPIDTTDIFTAVELGDAGVYFLGRRGLSTLPIHKRFEPRRGRRVQ